ncbi:MAG: Myeloperoxidase, thyroid peroxidase, cyclooxygenase catalytic domain [Nitrospira sp.]|nr:MAG: Myeloperoxidase, thyroid peroxidase, cyclooxygenase catalytic domain [Nitrospira sp.]
MSRHGAMGSGNDNPPKSVFYDQGKFGRLFPSLPPFSGDNPSVRQALKDIGKKGGIMDPGDDLSDPVTLITDPNKSLKNPDNPDLAAGMTFLGQFLDHDVTFDPTSSLERQQDPEAVMNFRTPALELDSVYGSGPGASPHLYDQSATGRGIKLLVEAIPGSAAKSRGGVLRFDVPRNAQGTALLGDPRNDENLIVSQLQLAFLKFHNAVVDHVVATTGLVNPHEVFAEAQRLVRWHYQWIVVHEFLPKTVGHPMVDSILTQGRKFYKWRHAPFIPVEFSVCAYRFGHSQVRPSYRANFGAAPGQEFFALIFNNSLPDSPDPNDLRGGKRADRRFIDWQTFFDFGDGNVRSNKKIDTRLSSVLFDLPGFPSSEPQSLAQRNLLRHLTFGLPSGQNVAKAMRVTPLPPSDLAELKPYGLDTRTPLWFYLLKEADVREDGKRLGPVGGRIVAEVFIGLLEADHMSYLSQDPGWTPTLTTNGSFTMTDLLTFAGVVHPLA